MYGKYLIDRGPNLVPFLLDTPPSCGTPTKQASNPAKRVIFYIYHSFMRYIFSIEQMDDDVKYIVQ